MWGQKKACVAGMKPGREKCWKCNENVKGNRQHDLFVGPYRPFWGSLVAQMVKNPPAIPETQVQSLGWEDALEKGMATHSSILAWRIPWTEEPGRLQSMRSHKVRHEWLTNTLLYITGHSAHDGNQWGGLLSRGLISDLFLNRTTEATGGSVVKKTCLPMQHIWVWSLGQEDPLEKEMATCSSFFAWRTPGTEEPGWQETMGSPRVRHDWVNTEAHTLRLLC